MPDNNEDPKVIDDIDKGWEDFWLEMNRRSRREADERYREEQKEYDRQYPNGQGGGWRS